MAVITLSNIRKSFGDQDLFQGVSFHINERERVALIGANGSGKTTLLRIIRGDETADEGTVSREPGTTIGYLAQEADLPPDVGLHLAVLGVTPELFSCAVDLAELEAAMHESTGDAAHDIGHRYAEVSHRFDTLGGFDYQIKARAILLGLGFDQSEFDKPTRALSGGQKTRAALARLLLLSPDVLLLDEPTNHLDIQACDWLQTFLQEKYQGAVLVVSHDRYFLNRVVSRVLEIDSGAVEIYPGNYSAFAAQKAARIDEQRKLYKDQQKEIARIETAIQTLFSDRKFSRRDNKIKQLARLKRIGSIQNQQAIKANLTTSVRSGREVLKLTGLAKSYPGKNLFSDLSATVERGRKIGIVGPNGSGKTTLLRIIAGREVSDGGDVLFGHNVEPIYFAQEFDHLVRSRTVVEELLADTDIPTGRARDLLAQFLFMGDDAFKKVEVLSGGEMCRLALAKVLADCPNLLLLDEPTNHLDIRSREALEDALRSFDGTVIVSSHDRYLLDAIADEIIEIKNGVWNRFLGNYSVYKEKTVVDESPAGVTRTMVGPKAIELPKSRPDSPLRAKQRLHRDLKKRQKELESSIEQTETRINELTAALGDEDNYRNGSVRELSAEYEELSARLDATYAEWELVCEEAHRVEAEMNELAG